MRLLGRLLVLCWLVPSNFRHGECVDMVGDLVSLHQGIHDLPQEQPTVWCWQPHAAAALEEFLLACMMVSLHEHVGRRLAICFCFLCSLVGWFAKLCRAPSLCQ